MTRRAPVLQDLLALALVAAQAGAADARPERLLALSAALRRRQGRIGRRHRRLGAGELAWLAQVFAPDALRGGFDPGDARHLKGLRRACAAVLSHVQDEDG